MSRRYYHQRRPNRDANELAIVNALKTELQASVNRIAPLPQAGDDENGLPDLLIGCRGWMGIAEVKSELGLQGGKSRHSQSLTPNQLLWWDRWQGPEPLLFRTPQDAVSKVWLATHEPRDPLYRLAPRVAVPIDGRSPMELEQAIVDYLQNLLRERDNMIARATELEAENRELRKRLREIE